jgi:hypothetical protein
MEQPKSSHLPVIRTRTFIGQKVALDGTRFENCIFKDCDILYSGGPTETSSCYFENVRWIFEGAAGTVVHVMQGLARVEDFTAPVGTRTSYK